MYISSYHQNIFFAFQSHPNLPPLGSELAGVLMMFHQSVQRKPHFRKVLPPGGVAEILCHIMRMTHFTRRENSEDEWTKNTSQLKAPKQDKKDSLEKVLVLDFSFFSQCCDIMSETWKGLCWGSVGGGLKCVIYIHGWKHFMCHFAKCKPKLVYFKVGSIQSSLTVFVITGDTKVLC